MTQLTLNIPEARAARDAGIMQAKDHADQVNHGWSDKAYEKLKEFLLVTFEPFQAEDVRSYAAIDDDFPLPPSERSWGSVILKAVKAGLIVREGYQNTKSVKSHRTPATLWRKL
jgi:hypothetical protein